MDSKKLNYISFSEMRDILERSGKNNKSLPYMKNDIGMLFEGNPTLANVLQVGVPYIIEEPRIGLIRKGTGRVMINMIERELHENTLALIGKGTIVQAECFPPDFEMCGMMISNERFNLAANRSVSDYQAGNCPRSSSAALGNMSELYFSRLHDNSHVMIIPVTADEAAVAYRMFSLCWDLLHREDEDTPGEAVNGLLHALVYYYDDMNKRGRSESSGRGLHSRQMFERFIALVNTHCREERSLDFYAGKMCVTARYLGTVVKNESGITAKEWLDRAVATSAKVLLRHTDRQITEIADTLHFSNTAFFCKFFRRMTGQSPQSYRRSPAPAANSPEQ